MVETEELPVTPVPRNLLRRPLVSTSTPFTGWADERQRRRPMRSGLETLREPSESPIPFQQQQQQQQEFDLDSVPLFGRNASIEGCSFSTIGIATSLEKMELCNNHDSSNSDNNENLQIIKNENSKNKEPEKSSSSSAHEEFTKQINKNTKKISPKRRSPKILKINPHKKLLGLGSTLKKTKSSKNKSPKTCKIPQRSPKTKSPKTVKLLLKSPKYKSSKVSQVVHKSPKAKGPEACKLKNSQAQSGTQCSALKTSKCPKSPKLHTAARAAAKQYREEMRKEKEKEIDELKMKMLEEQRREEEKEIQRLRQQMLFKAKPIRKYAPLPVVKKRPLTDPVSPNVRKRRRLEACSSQADNASKH